MKKDGTAYAIQARPVFGEAPCDYFDVRIHAVPEHLEGRIGKDGDGIVIGTAFVTHMNLADYDADSWRGDIDRHKDAVTEVLHECQEDGSVWHTHIESLDLEPGWEDADMTVIRILLDRAGDGSVSFTPYEDEPTPEQVVRWSSLGLDLRNGGVLYATNNIARIRMTPRAYTER